MALLLLVLGVVVLPLPIYWVGQLVIGEYPSEQGLWGLEKAIWTDLIRLNPLGWFLVLSPYAVVQMVRIGRSVWREGKAPWS